VTHETANAIASECKSIAYYLPSIETEVSPEVASDIQARLDNIERLTRHLHENELCAIRNMLRGCEAHSSSSDSQVPK
jgi:dsDNA-specific endonuclease/ATPase MutS2